MDKLDEYMHCSTRFPWLILALAIFFINNAIFVNSYQAEGGWCPKTFLIGLACGIIFKIGLLFWWFFLIPLVLPIGVYAFCIFWGYKVMQKSK